MISHFYRDPLNILDTLPPERWKVIIYTNMVTDLAQTIATIYSHFCIDMTAPYAQTLQKEQEKAHRYKSKHIYSLDKFVLTREQIVKRYEDIFNRFEFEKVYNSSSQS